MSKMGVLIGGALAAVGVVLMGTGFTAAPPRDGMLFIGGSLLLGFGGLSVSLALALEGLGRVPSSAPQPERIEPALPPRMPDPFTEPAPPMPAPALAPQPSAPALATGGAVVAAGAALAADAEEAVAASVPRYELPPLKPPMARDERSSILPSCPRRSHPFPSEPVKPEPEIVEAPAMELPEQAVTVPEPSLPEVSASGIAVVSLDDYIAADTPAAPVEAPPPPPIDDPFDLEAAIAAELALGPMVASTPVAQQDDPLPVIEEVVEAASPVMDGIADDLTAEPVAEPAETSPPAEDYAIDHAAEPAFEPEVVEEVPLAAAPPQETAEPAIERVVVGSYESGGVTYTLYEDGSVTAQAGTSSRAMNRSMRSGPLSGPVKPSGLICVRSGRARSILGVAGGS